ncbi:MAG TPA: PA2169 family four-helix-bundle protein [Blastocatellia bacterium]|nr:PA2169 family four-helix-bundle protein [Blastocatellia bacterium]
MDNDKVISTLNDLIETCRDGQNGFQEAADNVKNPELKEFFYSISQERARYVGELQQEVRALGGDPENTGSTAAALHRAWIDINGTLTGKDDASILNECERGEDSAVNAFKDALKEDLPANIRATVEREYQSVQRAHDRVKALRDSKSATTGKNY